MHRIRIPVSQPDRPPVRRSILNAVVRGLLKHCPNCGAGPSLEGYLTVRAACPHCGEKLGHIRADDGPAYLTVLLVAHIVVPLSLLAEQLWHPPLAAHMVVAVLATGLLVWQLLPRIKGAVVGLMWALGLHGQEVQGDLERHG